MKRRALLLLAVLFTLAVSFALFIYFCNQPVKHAWVAVVGNRFVTSDPDADWADFRSVYPYHIQTIALSQKDQNGNRTLIVSEPPPSVSPDAITAINPDLFSKTWVRQHVIGHGGWVKDFVATVNLSDADLESLLTNLNDLLFRTNYKAYVIPLPTLKPRAERYNLNLQVSAAELRDWIVQSKETLTPVSGGAPVDLASVFKHGSSKVYFTQSRGLVGWWIPRTVPVQKCPIAAREFAIDSDLVVGAVANDNGVLLVGRERQVPLDVLPPLRFETIALLGSVNKDELAQSYERTHPLAGRWKGRTDWAPILLSPELRDTEYGSLLNVADQFLKSWSNNGDTRYENFDYSQADRWPFPSPLPRYLNVTQVTYNWNTTGTGYAVKDSDYETYALNRTGALPISYIPGEKESKGENGQSKDAKTVGAEHTAYDYFAGLNNPYLVRVVQYAALYQIFQHFPLASPPSAVTQDTKPEQTFKRITRDLVHSFVAAAPDSIQSTVHNHADILVTDLIRFSPGQSISTSQFDDLKDRLAESWSAKILQCQQELKAKYARQADSIADEVSEGRQAESHIDLDPEFLWRLSIILKMMALDQNLPERLSSAVANSSHGWIHTPVIVASWNEGDLTDAMGGHNLRAGITKFEISPDVKPGHPEVTDAGVLKVSRQDANRVKGILPDVARAAQNEEDPRNIPKAMQFVAEKRLAAVPEAPIRSREAALDLEDRLPSAQGGGTGGGGGRNGDIPRGCTFPEDDPDSEPDSENVRRAHRPPRLHPLLPPPGKDRELRITVQGQPEGRYHIVVQGALGVLHHEGHHTAEDAADILARMIRWRGGPNNLVHIQLDNMSNIEMDALLTNLQRRYGSAPEEIRGIVYESGTDVDDLQQSIRQKHDFNNAKITQVGGIDVLTDGTKMATVLVEAPPAQQGFRNLQMRLISTFRSVVTGPQVQIITDQFKTALGGELKGRTSAVEAARIIDREFLLLKRKHPTEMLHLRKAIQKSIDKRNGDAYFVDRGTDDERQG